MDKDKEEKALGHDPLQGLSMDWEEESEPELPSQRLSPKQEPVKPPEPEILIDNPLDGIDLSEFDDRAGPTSWDEPAPMIVPKKDTPHTLPLPLPVEEPPEELPHLEELPPMPEPPVAAPPPPPAVAEPTLAMVEPPPAASRPVPAAAESIALPTDLKGGERLPMQGNQPEATFFFPADFRWGVATSAHQVEGNNTNNTWWAWEQEEGHIAEGHKSGRACDWWENAEEDFDRIARMGLNSLRLSVEWSRIEPRPGEFDDDAINRYREMLRTLRAQEIEPMVTLHHFTDPLWLAKQDGWENKKTISQFARFAGHVAESLGEYCDLWCTVNEPNVYSMLGYQVGIFPPGKRDQRAANRVLRHMLKGHAAAYREIHRVQPKARVGLAHTIHPFKPANPKSLPDRIVAKMADHIFNQLIITPLATGWWPLPLGLGFGWRVKGTLDWIGLNYYASDHLAFDRTDRERGFGRTEHPPEAELLDGDFGEFDPQGLVDCIKRLNQFGVPIYVTENGTPDDDDDQRPRHLMCYLHKLWHAVQQCYPVMGYYHWTLADNFEWARGWTLRFGLIEMDPRTQSRLPRRSSGLYSDVVWANAITPQIIEAFTPDLRETLLPGCRPSP